MKYVSQVYKKALMGAMMMLFCWGTTLQASPRLLIYPQAGVKSLLTLIDHAKQSIDLVMYGFTDLRLYRALLAAKKRGVKVRVLLQRAPYKAEDENTAMAQNLRKAAIKLRWSNPAFSLTHQKTLIIDNTKALIMTFNFTHSTFKSTRNFAILTSNRSAVKEIEHVFQADWNRLPVTLSNKDLLWSPENSLDKLLKYIASAHKTLLVYNQEMSQYQIVVALVKAEKRGVKVKVIVPYANRKEFLGKLRYLTCHGIPVRTDNVLYIHAKAMLADYKTSRQATFVGSMNFSDSGLMKNRELGILVSTNSVARKMWHTFNHDWADSRPLKVSCFH